MRIRFMSEMSSLRLKSFLMCELETNASEGDGVGVRLDSVDDDDGGGGDDEE